MTRSSISTAGGLGRRDRPISLPVFTTLPPCTAARRNQMGMLKGANGVADRCYVCEKTAADTYAWASCDAAGGGGGGATGPQGATGPTGPQGAAGSNGSQGPQGTAGSAGAQGPTGAQGVAGSGSSDWKDSVRVASTGNLNLAVTLHSVTVDGVTLTAGDRVLVKNQTTASENGIWLVGVLGAPARTSDANTSALVTPGATVYVEEGTANGQSVWTLTNTGTVTLGTTSLTFSKIVGATGPTGPQGVKGDTGTAGPQGAAGSAGSQGPQGVKGDTGTAGPQGVAGSAGPQGVKGDTGTAGPQGAAGSAGSQGPQGATGPTGAQGPTGPYGGAWTFPYTFDASTTDSDPSSGSLRLNGAVTQASSSKMYVHATDGNGVGIGTALAALSGGATFRLSKRTNPAAWLAGAVTASASHSGHYDLSLGSKSSSSADPFTDGDALLLSLDLSGPTGPQGAAGSAGGQGPTGPQGTAGSQGPQGPQGVKGDTGTAGPQGVAGSAGAQGPTGPQGPQGSAGPQGPTGAASTVTGPTGPQGVAGPTGPTGQHGGTWRFFYTFDSATSDPTGDITAGTLRLNNATQINADNIWVTETDALGADVDNPFSVVGSGGISNTGTWRLVHRDDPGKFIAGNVAGSVYSAWNFRGLDVSWPATYSSSSNPFANGDPVVLHVLPPGNKGATGPTGPAGPQGAAGSGSGDVTGPASSVDGEIALFSGTTGKTLKRASLSGLVKAASGVASAAVAGTDYCPATSGSGLLKGNGSGGTTGLTPYVATATTSISNGSGGSVTASCQTGEVMLSGGCGFDGTVTNNQYVKVSAPNATSGDTLSWYCEGWNAKGSGSATFRARVRCLS